MTGNSFSRAVTLQFEVEPGNVAANLATVKSMLKKCPSESMSLVVLPELWSTGFEYLRCRQLALTTPDLLEELRSIAAESRLVIVGSLLEPPGDEGDKPWNTLFVVDENGVTGRYRKQHLFAHWNEHRFFSAGDRPATIGTGGGTLGPLICYDLRFPLLASEHCFSGAQVLVVSAQWPKVRLDHWQVLLRARAIENQAFVVAANSCGVAGQIEFAGHSMVIAPDGKVLAEAGNENETVWAALPPRAVEEQRGRFCSVAERPWLNHDKDKIHDLPELVAEIGENLPQGSRVAFTNGCFDLLHSGHVSYLEQARRTADVLVVGLNSDRSVRALKGEGRPVNNERDRARVLAALGCVDYVVVFDEETPLRLIQAIQPDVLVKGADWPEDRIVGAAEVKAAGGRVERIDFEHQCSTTALIRKIQQ